VAACNPYQIKKIGANKRNDIVFTHPSKQNLLSHRVLPISSSLLSKIHDYGSLNKEVEKSYIESMMKSIFVDFDDLEKNKKKQFKRYLRTLVNTTSECQGFVKELNNNSSSLSLRDIHRVKIIFKFYLTLLHYKKTYDSHNMKFNEFQKMFEINLNSIDNLTFATSLIVTLCLNYVNRLISKKNKQKLKEKIMKNVNKIISFKEKKDIFDCIMNVQYQVIIDRIKELRKLPTDIAINTPLKENLFSIFVSIYARIPLFICGKPGSSKTVSIQIIKKILYSDFIGQHNSFLYGMKPVQFNYYQGSDQSTDKGVEKVFLDAIENQKKQRRQSVVFIDEIGLAELSPNNPLKVIHKFLDSTTHQANQSKLRSI
jgi:hypothetical protein